MLLRGVGGGGRFDFFGGGFFFWCSAFRSSVTAPPKISASSGGMRPSVPSGKAFHRRDGSDQELLSLLCWEVVEPPAPGRARPHPDPSWAPALAGGWTG